MFEPLAIERLRLAAKSPFLWVVGRNSSLKARLSLANQFEAPGGPSVFWETGAARGLRAPAEETNVYAGHRKVREAARESEISSDSFIESRAL